MGTLTRAPQAPYCRGHRRAAQPEGRTREGCEELEWSVLEEGDSSLTHERPDAIRKDLYNKLEVKHITDNPHPVWSGTHHNTDDAGRPALGLPVRTNVSDSMGTAVE